jgi:hypothetical protein
MWGRKEPVAGSAVAGSKSRSSGRLSILHARPAQVLSLSAAWQSTESS